MLRGGRALTNATPSIEWPLMLATLWQTATACNRRYSTLLNTLSKASFCYIIATQSILDEQSAGFLNGDD